MEKKNPTNPFSADLSSKDKKLHPAKNPRRVLIIEDDADSAETLKTLLELQHHIVETACDAENGIKKASEFAPEIIICDIGLPGAMDGHDVAVCLKKDERLKSIYLIALSGYGHKEDIEKSIEVGFNHHIVKPPDFDYLLALLENFETA